MALRLASPIVDVDATRPEALGNGHDRANVTTTAAVAVAVRRTVEGTGQAAVTRVCQEGPVKGSATCAAAITTTPAG